MNGNMDITPAMRKRPANYLDILMILVPVFMLGRVQEAFIFLWPFRLVLIVCLAMLLGLMAKKGFSVPRLKLFFLSTTFKWYLAMVILMMLSVIWSVYNGKSLGFLTQFAQFCGVFLLTLNCQVKDRDGLRYVLMGTLVTMFILALICFVKPRFVDGRVTAVYTYDPNDIALLFVMMLGLTLPALSYVSKMYKWCLVVTGIMCAGAIILTQSRGGLLAGVAVVCAWALSRGVKGVLRVVVFGVLGLMLVIAVVPAEKLGRFTTMTDLEDDYNMTAKHGRIDVWKHGLELFKEHMVLGTGVATFLVAEGQINQGGKWSEAHNAFIEVAVELGAPGFIIFMGMLISAYRRAKPRYPGDWLGEGIRLALVGYMVGGMFLSWGYNFVLYYVLCIAMVRERVIILEARQIPVEAPEKEPEPEKSSRRGPVLVGGKRRYKMREAK